MKRILALASVALATVASPALADITVCISLSATGPAASLGIPEQNAVPFLPTMAGDTKINYIIYDDATDPTAATRNARKCTEDDRADVIIGSSTAPTSASVASVAFEALTPVIALAPVSVKDDVNVWTFRAVQTNRMMASALVEHMVASNVKTLGFIGFADAFGDDWIAALEELLKDTGIKMDPVERFARSDTSVTGQALKIGLANPDAVMVVASGTPSALPPTALRERGYTGQIYMTHGSVSPTYIRVAGAAAEGSILPVGPVAVAEQLPDSHPSKAIAVDFATKYNAVHGEGSVSAFSGMMFDAGQLVAHASVEALKTAQPGTPEFRKALRDALENVRELVSVNGVYNTSPDDHYGHDERSRVLIQVKDGKFEYLPLN
ncbi:ABC transporter substrate-binding protein [Hoeflea alexandrii]|uniref:ABC transporter substrate-binding protein n=1 Tax=Hoeflea alexandrii TaxID=288436 RepID=UPI0022B0051B|nr:ABC transporter substrate-binding protein [Hoeflea alexandrii]MCZ4292239.1 ABC transporter substrate-binding protein [Hoeflea alexandrii]